MDDVLSVELEIKEGKATVKIDRFTQSLQALNADINSVGKNAPFAEKLTTDFVALEKKTNDVRKGFQSVSATRLDSGNIGFLTKEIVKTSERARQLQSDIGSIRRELANPARKSSIAFLTEELKAAEREAESLNRKLDRVNAKDSASHASGGGNGGGGGGGGRITDLQATALELTDDFVPEGFNRPFNAVARGLIGINALSLTTVATFGAIAAAGVAVVKITQNIREEAERRLKAEELIQGAINGQIIGQREALQNLQKSREQAQKDRQFNRDLGTSSIEELKRQRATVEELKNLTPATFLATENGKNVRKPNENFEKLSQRLLTLDAQIEQTGLNSQKARNDSFNQRFEDFKKNQQDAADFEKRQAEKREQAAEKAKQKISDLRDTFVSLKSADNPLLKQMTDLETATERARIKFGAFGDSVVSKIADIEKANLTKAINLQIFENKFEALKLNQQARQLAATPERDFAPFQRSLESVERKVDFVSKINGLNRQIDESAFYANAYNPNNPQTFNENRFGLGKSGASGIAGGRKPGESFQDFEQRQKEFTESAIKAFDAIGEIRSLNEISLEGTGIYGKSAVADKILSAIPSREDLLKGLNSPNSDVRGNAEFLLKEQSNALFTKRDFEKQKFKDVLENQKTSEFGRQFGKEQIGLINNSQTLTEAEKVSRRLAVSDALGNDLDPTLKRQRIQDLVEKAKSKIEEDVQTKQQAKDLNDLVKLLTGQLKATGIKIDAANLPKGGSAAVQITVKDDTTGGVKSNMKPSPQASDTAEAYYDPDFNFRGAGGFSNR